VLVQRGGLALLDPTRGRGRVVGLGSRRPEVAAPDTVDRDGTTQVAQEEGEPGAERADR